MNKIQLKEFLLSHFNIVLDNNKSPQTIANNKEILEITPNSIDDKCYIWVAEYVCMNEKHEKFFFVYYGKKNNILIYDHTKRNISIRLPNNATQRCQYDLLLKKVKKTLPTSKNYIIFFSIDKVEFQPSTPKNHIFVLNEENINHYLARYFDK